MQEFIQKIPGRFWGYAYCHPRSEKTVAQALAAAGIPCYLPLMPKARLHHGSKVVSSVPMIPGYIFLAADDLERSDLKRREKRIVRIELLRDPCGEELLISELNVLRHFELIAQTEKVQVNPGLQTGDKVRIVSGELQGLETIVVRRDDDHDAIVVNLTLLEQSVEYTVSAEMLKKITE